MTTTIPNMPPLALSDPTQIERFLEAMDNTLAPLAASIPPGSPLSPLADIIKTAHGVLHPFFAVINQFDILLAQQQQGVPAGSPTPQAAAPGRQFVAQLLGELISTLHTRPASGTVAPDVFHQILSGIISNVGHQAQPASA
jgi:hypothetical protein